VTPPSGSSNASGVSAIRMYTCYSVFLQKEMSEAAIVAKDPKNSSSAESSSDWRPAPPVRGG
jgi:hypothetical protein